MTDPHIMTTYKRYITQIVQNCDSIDVLSQVYAYINAIEPVETSEIVCVDEIKNGLMQNRQIY